MLTADDLAFIERHARDYWLIEVERNDVMARTYGFWFRNYYGNMEMRDIPDHPYAIREFRSQIPLF